MDEARKKCRVVETSRTRRSGWREQSALKLKTLFAPLYACMYAMPMRATSNRSPVLGPPRRGDKAGPQKVSKPAAAPGI